MSSPDNGRSMRPFSPNNQYIVSVLSRLVVVVKVSPITRLSLSSKIYFCNEIQTGEIRSISHLSFSLSLHLVDESREWQFFSFVSVYVNNIYFINFHFTSSIIIKMYKNKTEAAHSSSTTATTGERWVSLLNAFVVSHRVVRGLSFIGVNDNIVIIKMWLCVCLRPHTYIVAWTTTGNKHVAYVSTQFSKLGCSSLALRWLQFIN